MTSLDSPNDPNHNAYLPGLDNRPDFIESHTAALVYDDDSSAEYRLAIQASLHDVAARKLEDLELQKALKESVAIARQRDELTRVSYPTNPLPTPPHRRRPSFQYVYGPEEMDEDFPLLNTHSTVSSRDFDPETRMESEMVLQSTGYRPAVDHRMALPETRTTSTAHSGGHKRSASSNDTTTTTSYSSTFVARPTTPQLHGALNSINRSQSPWIQAPAPIGIEASQSHARRRPSVSSSSSGPQLVPISSLRPDEEDLISRSPPARSTSAWRPSTPSSSERQASRSGNAFAFGTPPSRPSSPWNIVPTTSNGVGHSTLRHVSSSSISRKLSGRPSSPVKAKLPLPSPPSPINSDSSDDWVKIPKVARKREEGPVIANDIVKAAGDSDDETDFGILTLDPSDSAVASSSSSREREVRLHPSGSSLVMSEFSAQALVQESAVILSDECMCRTCDMPLLYGDNGKLDDLQFNVNDLRRRKPGTGEAQLAKRLRRKCPRCRKTFCRGCLQRVDLVCLAQGPCLQRCYCAVFEILSAFDEDVLTHIGNSDDYERYMSHPDRKETFVNTLDILMYYLDPTSARRSDNAIDPIPNVCYLINLSMLSNVIRHLLSKTSFSAWYKDIRDQKVYHKLVVFLTGMIHQWGYPEFARMQAAKMLSSCGLRRWMHKAGSIEFGDIQPCLGDLLRPFLDQKGEFMKQVRRRPTAGNGRELCQCIQVFVEATLDTTK